MIAINVDAAEAGRAGAERDVAFLEYADAVNIALGGHAGEADWSAKFAELAKQKDVEVFLHPGYPDREGFGRRSMDLTWSQLMQSLNEQRSVLPDVSGCKFHGALYNEAMVDRIRASQLVDWCMQESISRVVAFPDSVFAELANDAGLHVIAEGFADRRYTRVGGQLQLVSRSLPESSNESIEEVVTQVEMMVDRRQVQTIEGDLQSLVCETICVHGDGEQSLAMLQAIQAWKIARDRA